jgi:hypothetical protein
MKMLRYHLTVVAALALPATAAAPWSEPLPVPLVLEAPPPEPPELDRPVGQTIRTFILAVNAAVPPARASALASQIVAASEARGLDPLLLTGIMAQESRFHADVQTCHPRGCDLGVGQVHWETWGAELRLDRHRLIHDDAYAIGVAADILADLRRRFGDEGGRWWTRYHDRRPERRAVYAELVRAHQPVLLGSL